jgi:hypothetical protein
MQRRRGGITLHTDYYERKYVTGHLCSKAFLFHVFVVLTLLILTFVLTFASTSKPFTHHDCSLLAEADCAKRAA